MAGLDSAIQPWYDFKSKLATDYGVRFGLALSYGKPSANGLRDQYSSELYYRMQLTRWLALTPSIQLIANPSANPDQELLALFGIRARLDF